LKMQAARARYVQKRNQPFANGQLRPPQSREGEQVGSTPPASLRGLSEVVPGLTVLGVSADLHRIEDRLEHHFSLDSHTLSQTGATTHRHDRQCGTGNVETGGAKAAVLVTKTSILSP
jgi:hypothetical protein